MRYETCLSYFKVNKIVSSVCLMFKTLKKPKHYPYLHVKRIIGLTLDNHSIDDNNRT